MLNVREIITTCIDLDTDWEGLGAYYDDIEAGNDGQPTEHEEWQDFYGGDDWDHGQFDSYDE